MIEENIKEFYQKGYTILSSIIPKEYLDIARKEVILLDLWRWDNNIEGDKDFGNGIWWKGFDMATKFSPKLMELYKSSFMYELATSFHKTQDIYFFNDEIVTKYPNERNKFFLHTDNEFGPIPEEAQNGDYRMINFYWMLDDVGPDSGVICLQDINEPREIEECKYLDDWETPPGNKWEEAYCKAGDLLVFNGNTLHYSKTNNTDKVRRAWATQYTTKPIGNLPYLNEKHPNDKYVGFYSDKFNNPNLKLL